MTRDDIALSTSKLYSDVSCRLLELSLETLRPAHKCLLLANSGGVSKVLIGPKRLQVLAPAPSGTSVAREKRVAVL